MDILNSIVQNLQYSVMSATFDLENGARQHQPRERLMVAEFVAKRFPGVDFILDARLGVTPEPSASLPLDDAERKMMRIYNRYCDAVVLKKDRTILIEAKLVPRLGPLDGLNLYEHLFKVDPQFTDRRKLPIEKWFVYAVEDSALNRVAKLQNIKPVQYVPAWMDKYVELLAPRHRRAPRVI